MYLGVLYVTLDLEPEVTSSDREKLLRSLRDKLKNAFGQRMTVRTDGESAVMVAFFDEGYARTKLRCDEILEKIEGSGEARVDFSQSQVFSWFDGSFQECVSDEENDDEEENDDGQTIRYAQPEDEEVQRPRLIPSRFSRKPMKPPVRR
jgi:hypothetical protein